MHVQLLPYYQEIEQRADQFSSNPVGSATKNILMSKSINKPRAYLVSQNGEIAERSRNTEKAKPSLGSQAPLNNRRGSIEDAAQ